jgi:hypothetical protein
MIFGSILGAVAAFDEVGNFGQGPKSTKLSNTSTSFTPKSPTPTFTAEGGKKKKEKEGGGKGGKC